MHNMSPLDEDWVDEEEYYLDDGQDDLFDEHLHEYLSRLDDEERQVPDEGLEATLSTLSQEGSVHSVACADAILPGS